MRLSRLAFRAIALSAVAAMAMPALANDLADPSFEDPSKFTMDGPPFVGSWEAFNSGAGTASQLATTMPHSGVSSLELIIDNTTNAFAGAFQDVNFGLAAAGNNATFSGWHKALLANNGIEIRIEWRNSVSNTEISRTPNFAPTPGQDYEEFGLTAAVPAGADTARVVYAIQSFGGGASQHNFVDDVSFSVVPEPASIGLATLCGAGLLVARRRR